MHANVPPPPAGGHWRATCKTISLEYDTSYCELLSPICVKKVKRKTNFLDYLVMSHVERTRKYYGSAAKIICALLYFPGNNEDGRLFKRVPP